MYTFSSESTARIFFRGFQCKNSGGWVGLGILHAWGLKNLCKHLAGKAEGKKPLERSRHIWEDNTEMDLKAIGWEDVDWFNLAKDRSQWRAVVNTIMNFRDP
jgi:hypothetical protein